MVVDGSTGEIMAASAWKLIRQCADTQGSGGRVSGLGKFLKLVFVVFYDSPCAECSQERKAGSRCLSKNSSQM